MSDGTKATVSGGKFALVTVERFLMALSMGMLCLLTMINVLVRYFTDISFAFTEEISVALMVVMTLIGASHAFATNHHIAITFFVERLPALKNVAFRFAYAYEVTSPSLGVPQWWYTIWLPVLSIVIVLRLLAVLMRGKP